MEAGLEQVMGYNTKDRTHMIMIKRKRTKRPRPPSPLSLTMGSTTSSTTEEGGGSTSGVSDNSAGFFHTSMNTPSPPPGSSIEFTKIVRDEDDHEEDMANCLILLAQGQGQAPQAVVRNKAGLYVYQCKTCNRNFPSFQALGGHRASHKKPKLTLEEKKSLVTSPRIEDDDISKNIIDSTTLSLRIISPNKPQVCSSNPNKTNKVHECSICGAEFTSGQALGGHMRRHRTNTPTATMTTSSMINTINESCQEAIKKPRNLLSLDLNLPAPPEDHDHHHELKFPFGSKEKIIVFSSSSLVDCHF